MQSNVFNVYIFMQNLERNLLQTIDFKDVSSTYPQHALFVWVLKHLGAIIPS